MYKYAPKFLLALSLLLVGGLTASYAQMDAGTRIKINIPHDFVLRDKTYSAGDYLIKPTDDLTDSQYVLELRSLDGKVGAIFDTFGISTTEPSTRPELIFDQVGDQYFLSKIWTGGNTNGNQVVESKTEKRAIAAIKARTDSGSKSGVE